MLTIYDKAFTNALFLTLRNLENFIHSQEWSDSRCSVGMYLYHLSVSSYRGHALGMFHIAWGSALLVLL